MSDRIQDILDDSPLHTLWSKAVGTPDYDKSQWKALEAKFHKAIATRQRGLYAAWGEVERLIAVNARHRSGVRMGEVSRGVILKHAWDELGELADAPLDPTEMADLLGVLFHYCIQQGWTMEYLASLMLG